jgi:hypothetical protein
MSGFMMPVAEWRELRVIAEGFARKIAMCGHFT